jgi:hypothetical protein
VVLNPVWLAGQGGCCQSPHTAWHKDLVYHLYNEHLFLSMAFVDPLGPYGLAGRRCLYYSLQMMGACHQNESRRKMSSRNGMSDSHKARHDQGCPHHPPPPLCHVTVWLTAVVVALWTKSEGWAIAGGIILLLVLVPITVVFLDYVIYLIFVGCIRVEIRSPSWRYTASTMAVIIGIGLMILAYLFSYGITNCGTNDWDVWIFWFFLIGTVEILLGQLWVQYLLFDWRRV